MAQPHYKVEENVALICPGSTAEGTSVARSLVRNGGRVVLMDRKMHPIELLAKELNMAPGPPVLAEADEIPTAPPPDNAAVIHVEPVHGSAAQAVSSAWGTFEMDLSPRGRPYMGFHLVVPVFALEEFRTKEPEMPPTPRGEAVDSLVSMYPEFEEPVSVTRAAVTAWRERIHPGLVLCIGSLERAQGAATGHDPSRGAHESTAIDIGEEGALSRLPTTRLIKALRRELGGDDVHVAGIQVAHFSGVGASKLDENLETVLMRMVADAESCHAGEVTLVNIGSNTFQPSLHPSGLRSDFHQLNVRKPPFRK